MDADAGFDDPLACVLPVVPLARASSSSLGTARLCKKAIRRASSQSQMSQRDSERSGGEVVDESQVSASVSTSTQVDVPQLSCLNLVVLYNNNIPIYHYHYYNLFLFEIIYKYFLFLSWVELEFKLTC